MKPKRPATAINLHFNLVTAMSYTNCTVPSESWQKYSITLFQKEGETTVLYQVPHSAAAASQINTHGCWLPCFMSNEYKLWELLLFKTEKVVWTTSRLNHQTANWKLAQDYRLRGRDSRQTDIEYAWYSMRLYHRLRAVLLASEHCCFSVNVLFISLFILMKG